MLCRTSTHINPFGELWINQRNSEFDSPYKFSGREMDNFELVNILDSNAAK
jgi:hypothetical protein